MWTRTGWVFQCVRDMEVAVASESLQTSAPSRILADFEVHASDMKWTGTSQIISWYYIECMILWFWRHFKKLVNSAGGIRIKSLWQLWDSTMNIRKTACKMVSFGSCFPIQNPRTVAEDTWLSGKVARIAGFGAFVTVSAPEGGASADGLLTPIQGLWGLSILQIFGICSHASGMACVIFDYHICAS